MTESTQRLLTWEELEDEFGPFELLTKQPDIEAADRDRTIWTMVEDDDGNAVYSSGWHYVNRSGYYRSAKPVPEGVMVDEKPEEE